MDTCAPRDDLHTIVGTLQEASPALKDVVGEGNPHITLGQLMALRVTH